jgi:chromosome segregation ATPase
LYESQVLGLDVQVDEDRLRFYAGTALLLESEDLITRLEEMLDRAQRSAEEEAQRREEAEQEIARLRAELEQLKR